MQTTSGNNFFGTDYEQYRYAVINYMKRYLKQINEDLQSIEPILGRVFEASKFYDSKYNTAPNLKPALRLRYLQDSSMILLQGILKQSKKFYSAKHDINVFDAVFVVGSGLSYESDVPMMSDLTKILSFIGATDFVELRRNMSKCYEFKKRFKEIIDRKKPGDSHYLIAKNFPSKIIEIICLNWDNLIERAFKVIEQSPNKINKETKVIGWNHLWKFHGDTEEFNKCNTVGNLGWVFPDEGGYVFQCFKNYLTQRGLSSKLFSLFIIGYSESDEQVQTLVNYLQNTPQRPTYRIGMEMSNFHNDQYLLGPSAYILDKILN